MSKSGASRLAWQNHQPSTVETPLWPPGGWVAAGRRWVAASSSGSAHRAAGRASRAWPPPVSAEEVFREMEADAVPVVLLVVGFKENPDDPADVSAMVLQLSDPNGEALPAEQSISQEDLDEIISSGRMPAVCMGSAELGQQWSQFGVRPGISMSFVLAAQPSVSAAGGGENSAAASSTADAAVAGATAPGHTTTDARYFESYEQMSVHELMLKDRPRTETYRDAISAAIARVAHERRAAAELGLPADEPIRMLDVGAGTGILCMCAAAAAKQQQVPIQIVAIEGSRMADVATSLIAQNGFADVVTIVHGAVEDLATLPGCRGGDVDIIVSEWMGFYLLHESMLNSVLVARDRWLRPGGLMLPSRAAIYAAPLSLGRSLSWWRNVYGFDYSPVISRVLEEAANHNPQCDRVVDNADVMAQGQVVAAIDCTTVTVASLAVLRKRLRWELDANAPVHGLVFWFDCTFPGPANGPASEIVLSTGPDAPKTHWHQTVVHFGSAVAAGGHDGGVAAQAQRSAAFDCSVELKVDPSAPRSYAITVELG